jgi:uncharacterized membrane protein YeaQ/YmgE (transglycosylase-associated protein family)
MKTDAQQGILLNVVVGIVGALIGAVILLAIVNLFRRGRVRYTCFAARRGRARPRPDYFRLL